LRLYDQDVIDENLIIFCVGCNPGPFTLQGTNTYLIGTGKRRILLDTGDGQVPEYFDLLQSVLKEHQVTLDQIILTHWHPDVSDTTAFSLLN